MVTIRVPAPSSMLIANVVAILGLVAVVAAIGGLAGVWWAVLTAGVMLVGLAAIALTHLVDEQAAPPAAVTPATPLAAAAPVPAEEQRAA